MERTMNVMTRNRTGELTWVDLVARDLEGQTRFYETLLGWTHEDLPTDQGPIYRSFNKDGLRAAAISQMQPEMEAKGMPSMWNTYFAAEDVDERVSKAQSLGGQVVMPAMDVMGEGRMAGVMDPTGGAFFFWQAQRTGGAEIFGVPGSLSWADLSSRDPEKAADFYSKLFDWKIDRLEGGPMPYWQVTVGDTPECGIMPMPPQLPAEVPSNWMPYFGVDGINDAVERAKAAGATVNMEPMTAGGWVFAVLSDPAGAVFSIMEPLRP
jgi:predicted enzyme related to lactoylglutathione lyase